MPTIDDLQEQGVKRADVLCPACARLFSVEFIMMFLHAETAYADIPRHRDFRCPSCGSTATKLMPMTCMAGHVEPPQTA